MERTLRELQMDLRFSTMLVQAYHSLKACRTPKHFINVQMGWVRRLESEFPLDDFKRTSVDTLKMLINFDLSMCLKRIQTGTNILKTAFD